MQKTRNRVVRLLLTSLLLSSCDLGRDEQTPESRPNVVLIVLDTVRRDRLSLYGYPRKTTPFLEELAKTSRLYTNAYSTSSWTAPAHASLFTGLFPIAHGATQEHWRLGAEQVTLAERLQRAGYRTIGVIENAAISGRLGFGQGFDHYHETFRQEPRNPVQALRAWLQRDDPRPFFAFVNLITAHAPYDGTRGAPPELRDRFLPEAVEPFSGAAYRWHGYYGGYQSFSAETFDRLGDLYDSCLLALDRQVKEIVDLLRQVDAWDDTVFLVTSDHGENLGEHGHYEHVFSLYQPTIRIPLLVHYPAEFAPGTRDHRPVQLTDIVPSLISLLDLAGDVPDENSPARDLRDAGFDEGRAIFAEYYRPVQALGVLEARMRKRSEGLWEAARESLEARYLRRLRVILQDDLKLIRSDDGSVELYDLSRDPEESTNLADESAYAGRRADLERTLREFAAREEQGTKKTRGPDPAAVRLDIDREAEAELRALGYLE